MASVTASKTFFHGGQQILKGEVLEDTSELFALYPSNFSTITPTDFTALTNSTGLTPDDTIASIPDPADTPLSADILRDDLVTNVFPVIEANLADLAGKVNEIIAVIEAHDL